VSVNARALKGLGLVFVEKIYYLSKEYITYHLARALKCLVLYLVQICATAAVCPAAAASTGDTLTRQHIMHSGIAPRAHPSTTTHTHAQTHTHTPTTTSAKQAQRNQSPFPSVCMRAHTHHTYIIHSLSPTHTLTHTDTCARTAAIRTTAAIRSTIPSTTTCLWRL